MIKKITVGLLLLSIVCAFVPQQAHAYEDDLKIIFKDALYGGLIGSLIGGAVMLFDPDIDNVEMIGYGCGAGIIAGTAYGLFTVSPVFEYKKESFRMHAPILKTEITNYGNKKGVSLTAEIFRYNF